MMQPGKCTSQIKFLAAFVQSFRASHWQLPIAGAARRSNVASYQYQPGHRLAKPRSAGQLCSTARPVPIGVTFSQGRSLSPHSQSRIHGPVLEWRDGAPDGGFANAAFEFAFARSAPAARPTVSGHALLKLPGTPTKSPLPSLDTELPFSDFGDVPRRALSLLPTFISLSPGPAAYSTHL